MHFKLDVKEKKTLMKKKKSGENGTFGTENQTFTLPFFCRSGDSDASVYSIYG